MSARTIAIAVTTTLAATISVAQDNKPAPAAPAPAAARPAFPPKPVNLQVLPKTMEGEAVVGMMRTYTGALGVRCVYCHVGEEGKPLTEYDFASDERQEKKTAREMIRMVMNINETIGKAVPRDDRTQVTCATCHRGITRPVSLEVMLSDIVTSKGADAGIAKYKSLREKYYGTASYDFGEMSLVRLAEQLRDAERNEDAVKILAFNAEMFPKSIRTLMELGETQIIAGDQAGGLATMEKALALDPENKRLQKRVEELRKPATPGAAGVPPARP